MNNLTIKTKGMQKNMFVFIDEAQPNYKKDKFSNRIYAFKTEKSEVTLKIVKYQELNTKLWWLLELMYFIVSVFGLFDIRGRNNYYIVEYETILKLNENSNFEIGFDYGTQKAFKIIKSDIENEEIKNTKQIMKNLKKRNLFLIFAKIIVWIGIITLAVILIMNRS